MEYPCFYTLNLVIQPRKDTTAILVYGRKNRRHESRRADTQHAQQIESHFEVEIWVEVISPKDREHRVEWGAGRSLYTASTGGRNNGVYIRLPDVCGLHR